MCETVERSFQLHIYVYKKYKEVKLNEEFFEYLKFSLNNICEMYPEITNPDEVLEKYLIIPKQVEKLKNTMTPTNCPKDIDDIKCRIVYVFD